MRISDQLSSVFPGARCYRLAGPKGDGRHAYCNEEGAYLGRATALVERVRSASGAVRFKPRSDAALAQLLTEAYGRKVNVARLSLSLGTVARALEHGDLARANIALVHAGLDPLPDEDAAERLAKADRALHAESHALRRATRGDLAKAGFNPDEARVPVGDPAGGQWTDGGSGLADDSGAQGPDARIDPNVASVYDALYRPSAADGSIQPLDVSQTIDPTKPVPVVLPDGTIVTGPDGKPILMPSGVSLADNAALGEQLANLPSTFDASDSLREAAMYQLFNRHNGTMDYQRNGGQFNGAYTDFGNYNYGVVAAAAGYTKEETLFASGMYNATSTNDKSGTYLNSPVNQYFIEKGYDDYAAGKITGAEH